MAALPLYHDFHTSPSHNENMLKIICCDGHRYIKIPIPYISISTLLKTMVEKCEWDTSGTREIQVQVSMEILKQLKWYFYYCRGTPRKCFNHVHIVERKHSTETISEILDQYIYDWLDSSFGNINTSRTNEDDFFRCLKAVSYLSIKCLESQMITWFKYWFQKKITLYRLLDSFRTHEHLIDDA